MEGKIKIGPVGGSGSKTMVSWDEGSHNGIISQIFLSHGSDGIYSIQFQFLLDDKFVLSDHHGRNTGNNFDVIQMALNSQHEYITGISGEYCTSSRGTPSPPHIRSLKFTTSTSEYGPFGSPKSQHSTTEEKFEFKLGKFRQFGGFYGIYDVSGLQYIGVYLQPTTVKPEN